MIKTIYSACILGILALPASAVITWTGGTDSDFTNDANWDFSGSTLSTVDGIERSNTPTLADNLVITNVGSAPTFGNALGSQFNFGVASGYGITVDGGSLTNSDNDGLNAGTIALINGASVQAFWAVATTTVDSTSSLYLQGGGNPLPGSSSVHLAGGATLQLASFAEFAEQGSQIFVGSVSYNDDNSILTFNGNVATAIVPEPSSAALLGLGGIALILRRRK